MKEKLVEAILGVMQDGKQGNGMDSADWSAIDTDVCIYGEGSPLDSIDFVRFLMLIEQAVFDLTEKRVTLMSEKAFSKKYNPFKNADRLADFIVEMLSDEGE